MNIDTSLTDVINIKTDEKLDNIIIRIEDLEYNILYQRSDSFEKNVNYWYQPTDKKFLNGCIIKIIKDFKIIYRRMICSFYGEYGCDDIIRNKYFNNYGYKGVMIEVGAGPPEFYSMSKHFRETGWRCICIEPNPNFVNQHRELGNEIYQFACSNQDIKESNFQIVNTQYWDEHIEGISNSAIEEKHKPWKNQTVENITIEIKKLDTILKEINIDKVDFVSVDTEGWELEVMEGFNVYKYQPKVILLENLHHSGKYETYMNEIGYSLDMIVDYNYIFIKRN